MLHWLLPEPNRVIAPGKHPVGGKLVTPILRAPSPYNLCHNDILGYWVTATKLCGGKSNSLGSVTESETAYSESDLNESGVGSDENVGELVRWIDSKKWIDVVVLKEIAGPCTHKVDGARENGIGFRLPYHIHHSILIFVVVIQLLVQWNCTLQNQ